MYIKNRYFSENLKRLYNNIELKQLLAQKNAKQKQTKNQKASGLQKSFLKRFKSDETTTKTTLQRCKKENVQH